MSELFDTCRACAGEAQYLWHGKLLDLTVRYFECKVCGYVQTECPYWLDRAYASTINDSDTGIMARNLDNARIVLATLLNLRRLDGRVVDYAGGYGILVRLLRDYGIDALWSDPYCQNLVARGFAYGSGKAALVTAFEAFEHFVHPDEELDRLLAIAPNVLFSTALITGPTPAQDDWWYYGREHGQHIGLFRLKTLELLASRRGKHFISVGRFYHLISDLPVNRIVWRGLLKVNRMLPNILWLKLKPKTWQDHLSISKQNH
jgi:hypothetical protein